MEQARDRVGLAGGDARAGIDVLVEHEAQEGREQRRPQHREPEGQDVPHGEADRAALQRGREDGPTPRRARVPTDRRSSA